MIPLCHDFRGETVLVFGGGPVGSRRARQFAREARVVVVAPAFVDADDAPTATGEIERVRAAPAPADVADWVDQFDPALVVAATDDPAVNDAVEAAGRETGALVNRADESGDRGRGSVVVPATVHDGPVTVAVTTGGASPALSGYLRERIEDELAGAGVVATVTAALRDELASRDVASAGRRDAIRAAVRDDEVWRAARNGDESAALARADEAVERVLSQQ